MREWASNCLIRKELWHWWGIKRFNEILPLFQEETEEKFHLLSCEAGFSKLSESSATVTSRNKRKEARKVVFPFKKATCQTVFSIVYVFSEASTSVLIGRKGDIYYYFH